MACTSFYMVPWLAFNSERMDLSVFGVAGRFPNEILSRLASETRELAEPLDSRQTKAVAALRHVNLTWPGAEEGRPSELASNTQSAARL